MLFSSAYATVMGVLPPLITDKTAVISDALNHNCIINAIALARPAEKRIYRHLDLDELERHLASLSPRRARAPSSSPTACSACAAIMRRSTRSCSSPPSSMPLLCRERHRRRRRFARRRRLRRDGPRHRGGRGRGAVDVLIGTLGKAFGVNGGYVVASEPIVGYLRETSPFYIYSNPITPGEAEAALVAVDRVDSEEGRALLAHLRAMTARFRDGLAQARARDGRRRASGRAAARARHARARRASSRTCAPAASSRPGSSFPVVPKGEEEIRFQISADHTAADIDEALGALAAVSHELEKADRHEVQDATRFEFRRFGEDSQP